MNFFWAYYIYLFRLVMFECFNNLLFLEKYIRLKKIEDENNLKNEEKKIEMRKRFMFLFL